MTSWRLGLPVLPLVRVAILAVAGVAAFPEDLNCSDVITSTNANPTTLRLDHEATQVIRFSRKGSDKWTGIFRFGEGIEGNFNPHVNFEVTKTKPNFYLIKLYESKPSRTLMSQKVMSKWIDDGGEVAMSLRESTFTINFHEPKKDRKLLLELTDPQIKALNTVVVKGNLQLKMCEAAASVTETTTTTTVAATTTTTTPEPTTTASTTITTTTPVTTTTDVTTTTTDVPTTTQYDTTDTSTTTTMEGESPTSCLPTEDSKTDASGTTACTPASEPVMTKDVTAECNNMLLLVWICGSVAAVSLLIILMLIGYIVLKRRNWRIQQLKSSESGGFGRSAQDMYYYEMKNTSLMIGNTIPRIRTPRPSPTPSPTPGMLSSASDNHLSTNYGYTPTAGDNTLPLPTTKLMQSTSDTRSDDDKARLSKVSSADE